MIVRIILLSSLLIDIIRRNNNAYDCNNSYIVICNNRDHGGIMIVTNRYRQYYEYRDHYKKRYK